MHITYFSPTFSVVSSFNLIISNSRFLQIRCSFIASWSPTFDSCFLFMLASPLRTLILDKWSPLLCRRTLSVWFFISINILTLPVNPNLLSVIFGCKYNLYWIGITLSGSLILWYGKLFPLAGLITWSDCKEYLLKTAPIITPSDIKSTTPMPDRRIFQCVEKKEFFPSYLLLLLLVSSSFRSNPSSSASWSTKGDFPDISLNSFTVRLTSQFPVCIDAPVLFSFQNQEEFWLYLHLWRKIQTR